MTDTRKQVECEIAEWLRAEARRLESHETHEDFVQADALWCAADQIERGEYRKDEA